MSVQERNGASWGSHTRLEEYRRKAIVTKQCSKCKLVKELSQFYKSSKIKCGYRSDCKECGKKYKQNNKDIVRRSVKKYDDKNKMKKAKRNQILREKYKNSKKSYIIKKWCTKCQETKKIEYFNKNSTIKDGYNSWCKYCINIANADYYKRNPERKRKDSANRRCSKIQRTPKWANIDKIKEIYLNVPPGHDVDHIVPLNGKNVSGLHVDYNLQYLLSSKNRSKGNKY